MLKKLFMVTTLIVSLISSAYAGVVIGGTRVVYEENLKEAQLLVYNKDSIMYLIQSWVGDADNKADSPFIITPPLFKLSPKTNGSIRIVNIKKDGLPSDRESLFELNIKAVPATESGSKNHLLISTQNVIKLIYRPASLSQPNFDALDSQLSVKKSGNQVEISNSTPYFINLTGLSVAGQSREDPSKIDPFGKVTLDAAGASTLSFKIIDDNGIKSKVYQYSF